ncbi:MerR family transcriptional regulator [Rhodococcus qingshengii]|uniref:MerR family transcriptional regulator n=1 Tax=Rhodococcus TaxID=1827 RepID=UPI00080621BE|nr:MerR family transcriptional regulator [Rhodococcus qingshengii]ANQ75702.1 MerR family transcriptional regulator [Rhodococcus sp. 008]SCC68928.1 DNA-binding transcriptional regulator, MerR family [Rhodococcus qingshengii]
MAVTDAADAHAAPARRGVYGISVMSELSGVGPQTLRLYERRGLLTPARTSGGTRRYSEADLATLRRISTLIADGINLSGIGVILALETQNAILAERIAQLSGTSEDGASESDSRASA